MGSYALLDGGVGHEVKSRLGTTTSNVLAGCLANVVSPETVVGVHKDFFEAAERGGWRGEMYATTNNFVATPFYWEKHQEKSREYLACVRASAVCAREAASDPESTCSRKVAGCLPPLGECYAESSQEEAELVEIYVLIGQALIEGGRPDVFLAETLASAKEASAAAKAAQRLNMRLWVTYTLADDDSSRLRGGAKLSQALSMANDFAAVEGLGVNCSRCETINASLDCLMDIASEKKHVIAYANDFQKSTSTFLRETQRPDCCDRNDSDFKNKLGPERYADRCRDWAAKGVTVLGGCCGTSPDHIYSLAKKLLDNDSMTDDDAAEENLKPKPPTVAKDLMSVAGPLFEGMASDDHHKLLYGRFAETKFRGSARVFWRRRWPSDITGILGRELQLDNKFPESIISGLIVPAIINDDLDSEEKEQLDRGSTHVAARLASEANRTPSIHSHHKTISTTTLKDVANEQILTLALAFIDKKKTTIPAAILKSIHSYLVHDLSYFKGRIFKYDAPTAPGRPAGNGRRRGCGTITSDGLAVGLEALFFE